MNLGSLRKVTRRTSVGIGLAVMMGAGLAAPAAASDAGEVETAANRYVCGNYCDGKSPYTLFWDDYNHVYYRCTDDDYSVDSFQRNGQIVYLRYSPKCETAWTLVRNYVSVTTGASIESYYLNYSLRDVYYVSVPGGKTKWTAMVNDHNLLARSCEGGSSYCTKMW